MKALVTGASRGLGQALAAGLAREGYDLIADARNAGALASAGLDAQLIAGDITDPVHRETLRQAAGTDLDLLVNNAGTLGAHPLPALTDYPVDDLRAAFEVNVIAPIALTQLLLPTLRQRGGAVLNITSDAAVPATFDFTLPPPLEAHVPPEPRDAVRLLVSRREASTITHHPFAALPAQL